MGRTVAILGTGAVGSATAVDLVSRGYRVRRWARRPHGGALEHEGVLGAGRLELEPPTVDLGAALADAELAIACLPATGLADVAALWAALAPVDPPPLLLNPGGTGGALLVAEALSAAGMRRPALAELSTSTFTARQPESGQVSVFGATERARIAALPGSEQAVELSLELYPRLTVVGDVLATSLSNLNMVLNPPGSVLGLAWIEATAGAFRFYGEGVTPGVANTIAVLDAERRATAAAFGHDLPSALDELLLVGMVRDDAGYADAATAIARDPSTSAIGAPDSTAHRYYGEDTIFSLARFVDLARCAGVSAPVAEALLTLAATAAPAHPRPAPAAPGLERLLQMVR